MGRGSKAKGESRARKDFARLRSKKSAKHLPQVQPSWVENLNGMLADPLRYEFGADSGITWKKEAGFYTCELPNATTVDVRYRPIVVEQKGRKIGYHKKRAELSVNIRSSQYFDEDAKSKFEGLGAKVDDVYKGIAHLSFYLSQPDFSKERETVNLDVILKISPLLGYIVSR